MKIDRRKFLKGTAATLASLFCLGTKKPETYEQPYFEAKTSIEELELPGLELVIKHGYVDQQTEAPCNLDLHIGWGQCSKTETYTAGAFEHDYEDFNPIDELPLRDPWNSPYFVRPYKHDCSNCNQYFCGPGCNYWWKRDYFEPEALITRKLMPLFDHTEAWRFSQDELDKAEQHYLEKMAEYNRERFFVKQDDKYQWYGDIEKIECPDPNHPGQFVTVAEVESDV